MAASSSSSSGQTCECLSLSQAISHNDLQGFLNRRQTATASWIDAFETPLQKACTCGQLEIIKKQLLHQMEGNMVDYNYYQSLKLDVAAGDGDMSTVEDLYKNNTQLLRLENSARYGLAIPAVRASNAGHEEIARYLHKKTNPNVWMYDGGYWAICLLLDAIFYGFIDIALKILDQAPDQLQSLAVTKHQLQRSSPLRFLALKPDLFRSHSDLGFWRRLIYNCAPTDSEISRPNLCQRLFWMVLKCLPKWFGIKQICDLKDRHFNAQHLLQIMCGATQGMVKDASWKESVYESLLEAVENGNKEFFIEIITRNPELLWISKASSGRNLFQLAVEFRKEKIFNLIHGLDDRKTTMLRSYDKNNNNILHIAAYPSPLDHLSKISGSALKIQRASQWYKEVNNLVSKREVVQKNKDNKTPRQVFEESYEPLRKEGEEWMKYTATACSFVAALTATVTFQAIFTVPGGNDDTTGKPILLRDLHFTAFIMADTLAFFSSCTSVLIFLSILTARYSFDDFIVSLPRKMILALTILFISIAAMLVAFITSLSASMRERPTLVVPMKPLAAFPGLLFFMLQYPLLKEMISSTYGRGFFYRDTKNWYRE